VIIVITIIIIRFIAKFVFYEPVLSGLAAQIGGFATGHLVPIVSVP
jgi:hypothetical protein